AALGEIEGAAGHDAEQERGRGGKQNGEAERDGHARDRKDGRVFRGLSIKRSQQAQVIEGRDAAVDETEDGEREHPALQGGGEDIKLREEAAGEGNADE